jgi:sphinganine C4-monooxygenase
MDSQTEPRPPLLPFISDQHLSLTLPIIAYWAYSGVFHFLDMQTWPFLDKYRIHPAEEILKRNKATRLEVVRDVLIQQLGQVIVQVLVFTFEPPETVPNHSLQVQKLLNSRLGLPNLASAEICYWVLIPLLKQLVAIIVLDSWEYWIHRFMHMSKFLYRHIHGRHHRLYVPYAYGALYNHPLEGLILDTCGGAVAMKISCLSLREAMIFFVFATMKTGINILSKQC